ncbi:MAG: flagellin [Planctomycetota bacterium]
MSSFISGVGRVPNLLTTRTALNDINRTNVSLFTATQQLSTGLDLLSPSQDAVRSSLVSELDTALSDAGQRLKNLDLARTSLNTLDQSLRDIGDLLEEAYSIGLGQIGAVSTASEREDQALVIESILEGVLRQANSEGPIGYVFGGSTPGTEPIQQLGSSYLFVGEGSGLFTRATDGRDFPVTAGAGSAVGMLSGRVQGTIDLNPRLTTDTRLTDLAGAGGQGIRGGTLSFSFNGGPDQTVDLTGADTVGDVTDRITLAIRDYETAQEVTVLGTGGVSVSGESIAVDVPAGSLEFKDTSGSVTALDLGLRTVPAAGFNATLTTGQGLGPTLTLTSRVSDLAGVTTALGMIRIRHAGQTADVDLSGANTIADIRNLIEQAVPGVRVELNAAGNGIDVLSELSGVASDALSIQEVPGNADTAAALGIRSLQASTLISDFNFGRGVRVNDGESPPEQDVDFSITLPAEPAVPLAELTIEIDLTEGDLTTVQSVLDAINGQINTALAADGRPTTDLAVGLNDVGNGISLTQAATYGTPASIEAENNSQAAEDLGLLDGVFDPAANVLRGSDRATVRAESVFTHLADLALALREDDRLGMEIATNNLKSVIDEVADTRALYGGYGRRAEDEVRITEDRTLVDQTLRSQARDLDFTEAASRFSLLQTQLQAGLQTASLQNQLTLLNFI